MSNDANAPTSPKETKTVTLSADLYVYFEEQSARGRYFGRPVDTIIEAILAAHIVNCEGESEDDKLREFYKRLNVTQEEIQAEVMADAEKIRESEYAKRESEDQKKDNDFDA